MAKRKERTADVYNIEKSKGDKRKVFNDFNGIDQIELSRDQQEYKEIIQTSDITFCASPAGAGKTFTSLYAFVDIYLKDRSKDIVIAITPTELGLDPIGFLKGSLDDKLSVYKENFIEQLTKLLSKNKVEADLDKRIKIIPVNYMLGRTFDNSLILVSEAQQLAPMMVKLILERIGEGSKIVVEGDASQLYAATHGAKRQGLQHAIKLFQKFPTEGVDFYEFPPNHNVRSDICGRVNSVYKNAEF